MGASVVVQLCKEGAASKAWLISIDRAKRRATEPFIGGHLEDLSALEKRHFAKVIDDVGVLRVVLSLSRVY
jgi:hypothetical protein